MSIIETVTSGARRLGRALYAKSPTLLVVGGTVGLVAAGVIACIETKENFDQVMAEHRENVQKCKDIRDGKVKIKKYTTEEYQKVYKKQLTYEYWRTVCKFFKVYLPSLLIAAGSIGMILSGHHILNGWFKDAVDQGLMYLGTLTEYRKRVAGVVGEEKEKLIYLDANEELVNDKITDPETGSEMDVITEQLIGNADTKLPHTYIADETTMCSWAMCHSDADFRRELAIKLRVINDYFERNGDDGVTLHELMNHFWKGEYLKQHPEVRTDGWLRNNPFVTSSDEIRPIEADVRLISAPGEPRRYSVTFNAQGNIVRAMEMMKDTERAERKARRFKNKKVVTSLRPTTDIA